MEPPSSIFRQISDAVAEIKQKETRITIVGCGAVGIACGSSILQTCPITELVLFDVKSAIPRLKGEALDLSQGMAFRKAIQVIATSKFERTRNSAVIVITAGAKQLPGESRLNLLDRNMLIFHTLIPALIKQSPDTILLVISNPCDVMSYLAWNLSSLPAGRVIGTGTSLDSSRFRVGIAQRLHIDPRNVHGFFIGEHGDSSVAVWSQAHIAGMQMKAMYPQLGGKDDPERWNEVAEFARKSADAIIKLKGSTSWAIGMVTASLINSILSDSRSIRTVSVLVDNMFGITNMYLSMPAIIGSSGVIHVLPPTLSPQEIEELQRSANVLKPLHDRVDMLVAEFEKSKRLGKIKSRMSGSRQQQQTSSELQQSLTPPQSQQQTPQSKL